MSQRREQAPRTPSREPSARAGRPVAPALSVPERWGAAYLTPYLAGFFQRLSMGCGAVSAEDPAVWIVLCPDPATRGRMEVEAIFGAVDRPKYNQALCAQARASREMVVGEIDGYHDFCVPVVSEGQVKAFLIAGPFLTRPLTVDQIRAQWQNLGGGERESTPSLLEYARLALDSVLLEPPLYEACRLLLGELASTLCGQRSPQLSLERILEHCAPAIDASRSTMWELARGLVDSTGARSWQHANFAPRYAAFSVTRGFTHVCAVAPNPRATRPTSTPIDGEGSVLERLVEAHALQREAADLAASLGETIAGRLGDSGAFFLVSVDPGDSRALSVLANGIRTQLEQRSGIALSMGVSNATAPGEALPRAYDEATEALNWALVEGRPMAFHADRARRKLTDSRSSHQEALANLRRSVSAGAVNASELAAHALSRALVVRARGSLDALRAYFESALLDLLAGIQARGVLDARALSSLEDHIVSRLRAASGVYAQSSCFQEATAELARTVRRPAPASREARLDAARRHIEHNCHLTLRLDDVARLSGLSPRYFSKLFRERFGVPFDQFLSRSRLERARTLLLSTRLPIARVSRDAGFSSDIYFFSAFKRAFGKTPSKYRDGRRAQSRSG
jgi:AraC-like DNA-binding protein